MLVVPLDSSSLFLTPFLMGADLERTIKIPQTSRQRKLDLAALAAVPLSKTSQT